MFSLTVFLPYSLIVRRTETVTFAGLVTVEVTPDQLFILIILLLTLHSMIRVTALTPDGYVFSVKESLQFRESLFSYMTSFGITLYLISVLNIGIAIYNFEAYSFGWVIEINIINAIISGLGILASPFIMAFISEYLLLLLGVPDHHRSRKR